MPRKEITWADETRACLVDIGKYFKNLGNPRFVDEAELRKYLKEKGHGDPAIGIATSGIYFQM